MAESTPKATGDNYNFSSNTITAQDYQTIVSERDDVMKKQLAANNEFMFQHYARLLRNMDISYERATSANVVLERKARRQEAKKRREALRANRK